MTKAKKAKVLAAMTQLTENSAFRGALDDMAATGVGVMRSRINESMHLRHDAATGWKPCGSINLARDAVNRGRTTDRSKRGDNLAEEIAREIAAAINQRMIAARAEGVEIGTKIGERKRDRDIVAGFMGAMTQILKSPDQTIIVTGAEATAIIRKIKGELDRE